MMSSSEMAWALPGERLRSIGRVCLWLCCVALAAAVLAALFSGMADFEIALVMFKLALILAIPGVCLYLPIVLGFRSAYGRRLWIMIGVGVLIGPPSIILFNFIQYLRGVVPTIMPQFDELSGAGYPTTVIIGFLSTAFYGLALRLLNPHPPATAKLTERTDPNANHLSN